MNLGNDRIPGEVDLGILERPGSHDLAGSQLVAAVHDRHRLGESGQEDRFFDRDVTTTDDRNVLVSEEEAGRRWPPPGHTVAG
jgi:hypothetical protein